MQVELDEGVMCRHVDPDLDFLGWHEAAQEEFQDYNSSGGMTQSKYDWLKKEYRVEEYSSVDEEYRERPIGCYQEN